MNIEVEIPRNLICGVQALIDLKEDCNQPFVSDGKHWFCPYGHIQGYDKYMKPIREIPDLRTSVKK